MKDVAGSRRSCVCICACMALKEKKEAAQVQKADLLLTSLKTAVDGDRIVRLVD